MSSDIIHLEIRQLREAHKEFRATCLTCANRMQERLQRVSRSTPSTLVRDATLLSGSLADTTEIIKAGIQFANKVHDFLDRMDVLLAPERTTVIIDTRGIP